MRRSDIGLILFALAGVVVSALWIASTRTGAPAQRAEGTRIASIDRLTPLVNPGKAATDAAALIGPEELTVGPGYDIAGRLIWRVNVKRKLVALTFDDGPTRKTLKILAILNRYGAKATFFVVSDYIGKHLNLIQAMAAQGSEVGNHTDTHIELDDVSPSEIARQLDGNQQAIAQILGAKPTLFRPPVGKYDEDVVSAARKRKLAVVLWSVHGQDTGPAPARELADNILASVRPGDIVLLHEAGTHTLEALPIVMSGLKERGYQFVTVSELLAAGNLP